MNFQFTAYHLNSLYETLKLLPSEEDRSQNQSRYALPIPFGSIQVKRTRLRGGLEISEYEGALARPLSLRFETKYPHLELSCTSAGSGVWSGHGASCRELAPGVSTLMYMADHPLNAQLNPAERMSHTEVRIDLRCFRALEEEVRRLTSGGFYSHQLIDHPQVAKLFEQLKICPYAGALRQLYLEGKCYELLACQFGQAGERTSERKRFGLSADDIRSLHQARGLLARSWREPLGLLELARSVGINDYKLKRGFKELFGTTVFGHIRDLRMNEARRLLESGQANVSQAAVHVGYANLSHFASAYRRTFGYNPSECLRQGTSGGERLGER